METHSTSTNTLARSGHVSESVVRSYGVLGHANDDQTPSSSTTTPPTTPPTRNTGYGDFCFGRQDMFTLSKKVITDPYGRKTRICYTEEEGLRSGSKNVLHQEIDGFERRGYFPFFKLPLDIRRKIYRELVQPFFELDPDSNQYVLNLALMEQRTLYSAIDFQSRYIRNCEEFESKEVDQRLKYDRHVHPERTYCYTVQAPVRKPQIGPHIIGTDWLMIDLMRHLSNVSSQFRHELGSIVWANTRLIMGATDTGLVEMGDRLLAFLEERPAAHQGIKSLSISLDYLESWCDGYGDPISKWCQVVAETLDLTSLTVELKAHQYDLDSLALGKGPLQKLTPLRTLKVRGDFKLNLLVLDTALVRHSQDDVTKAHRKHVAHLQRKYREPTRQLLMPDTLRQSEPPTEVEKYLNSRQQIISSAAPPKLSKDDYSDAYFPWPWALGVSYDSYLTGPFARLYSYC